MRKACQGRPVTEDDLALLAQEVEETVRASGLAEIDAHVLDATCREVSRWAAESGRAVTDLLTMVNVNCSDQTFLDAGLAGRALAAGVVLAHDDDALVALHLLGQRLVDRLAIGDRACHDQSPFSTRRRRR